MTTASRKRHPGATDHRLKCKRGTELPQSKLTEAQAIEIRALHAAKGVAIKALNDNFSAKALAANYGVHVRTVEKILQRAAWIHTLKAK